MTKIRRKHNLRPTKLVVTVSDLGATAPTRPHNTFKTQILNIVEHITQTEKQTGETPT